ncbi:hypothetical protein BFI45_12900 [Yersinia pestis subsp. microtus bv. Altaica]|nr:hypothetical protein EGX42_16130 [Yersinia pestis]AYX16404.1 hypothetical protein EGX44_15230 [Yersinia pseudotuberculosis]OUY13924.1 hypothetical protein BFI40_13860 [Yersinia pestis subsp. microtus bv. Altaica]OVY75662.1 hypothetical protein BFI50_12905 [Yersinia pestis subsp. microtus bv. Xilingolensis]OVY88852.1 hypothetical protein BFI53_12925 [Yersinia pestis subsp. microtus]QFR83455.1 hypothetical protein DJY80_00055 [Yersinia pestis subsp. pestis bv. Medievalis]
MASNNVFISIPLNFIFNISVVQQVVCALAASCNSNYLGDIRQNMTGRSVCHNGIHIQQKMSFATYHKRIKSIKELKI